MNEGQTVGLWSSGPRDLTQNTAKNAGMYRDLMPNEVANARLYMDLKRNESHYGVCSHFLVRSAILRPFLSNAICWSMIGQTCSHGSLPSKCMDVGSWPLRMIDRPACNGPLHRQCTPQTSADPVCLGIDNVCGNASLRDKGSGRQTKYLPCSPIRFP